MEVSGGWKTEVEAEAELHFEMDIRNTWCFMFHRV